MKLDRVPEYFITALVLFIGLAIAIFVGMRLGTGNTRTVVLIVGALCFLILGAVMGRHVWLLIPFSVYGGSKILTLPITMAQAGAVTAFIWWVVFVAFRQVKKKNRWGVVDYLMILNVLYLVALYVRQPFGGRVFSSNLIGIAPYFFILFALMGYWVLSRVELSEKWARRLPWLSLLGAVPSFLAVIAVKLFPSLTPVTAFVFGVGTTDPSAIDDVKENVRHDYLVVPMRALLLVTFAYFPIRTLLNPLYVKQMLIVVAGCCLILLSGFRNAIGTLGLLFILIAWYRGSIGRVIRFAMFAVPLGALILAGHGTLYHFPFAVQRSLSFLPAKWDQEPLDSAEDSSNWRYEMWELMFEDSKYLKDRWFGDGFGYSEEEFITRALEAAENRFSSYELFILTGAVHSGPYSAIRFAGYVGLGLLYIFIIPLAIKAHRIIRRSKGTPYEFVALVVGIPLVAQPFIYTFIYGAYNLVLAECIVALGFLKMIEAGLAAYRRKESKALADVEAEAATRPAEVQPASPLGLPA